MRALCLLVLMASCSDAPADPHGDPCAPPLYAGEATDDAWLVVLDAYAQASPAQAVSITTPRDGEVLDGATRPTFAWDSPLEEGMVDPLPEPRPPHQKPWLTRALSALGGLFEGTAHAHLPPITGDIYYLEISLPGEDCALTVLTTEAQWMPDAVTWAKLRASAGAALTLTVTSAYLRDNVVVEGPYRAPRATSFTVR